MLNFIPKKIIGIDFDDYSAQLVEIKFVKNELTLETYNRILLPKGIVRNGEIAKEKELQAIISKLFAEANPHKIETKEIAFLLPSTKVFTHIFSFPAKLKENEIKNALLYEAETVIPFAIQDIYWDYSIINKNDEKTDIFFAAIPKDIADKYTAFFQKIELVPSYFTLNVDSLKQTSIQQVPAHSTAIVIDMNSLTTNYLVIKENQIKHFISTNKSGLKLVQQISKDFQIAEEEIIKNREENKLSPKYLPKITSFLEDNYKIGQKIIKEQYDKKEKVDTVILSGHFINFHNFYHLARKHFRNMNILVADPRKYLKIIPEKFQNKNNKIQAYSTYFINAVGAALRGLLVKDKNGINLLPDHMKQTSSQQKKAFIIATISVVMCVLSLLMAATILLKHQEMAYQRVALEIEKSTIDKVIYGTRYSEIREAIIAFNSEVNDLSTIDNSLFSIYKVTSLILAEVPDPISLVNISFSDEALEVNITGIADNREALLTFTRNLKELEFVEEVITPISNFDDKSDISFILTLKLVFKDLPAYATNGVQ